jgi:hypothetical protein
MTIKESDPSFERRFRGHDLLVARSRALDRAVAEKLRADHGLLNVASRNLERWIAQEATSGTGTVSPALLEWQRILAERSAAEIAALLAEESEEADRLRHATPFCGILTPQERDAIYRRYASHAVGWCLEVHDLAVSKLFAGREKDLNSIAALLRHAFVNEPTLRERMGGVEVDFAGTDAAQARLSAVLRRPGMGRG